MYLYARFAVHCDRKKISSWLKVDYKVEMVRSDTGGFMKNFDYTYKKGKMHAIVYV